MFCSKCGAQLPDDSMFCNVCGSKTINAKEPAAKKEQVSIKVDLGLSKALKAIGNIHAAPEKSYILMFFGIISVVLNLTALIICLFLFKDLIFAKKVAMSARIFALSFFIIYGLGWKLGIHCIKQKNSLNKVINLACFEAIIYWATLLLLDFSTTLFPSQIKGLLKQLEGPIIGYLCFYAIMAVLAYTRKLIEKKAFKDYVEKKLEEEKLKQAQENTVSMSDIKVREGYESVLTNGKYFTSKISEPGSFYCPKCYEKASPSSSSCNNCNWNFYKPYTE